MVCELSRRRSKQSLSPPEALGTMRMWWFHALTPLEHNPLRISSSVCSTAACICISDSFFGGESIAALHVSVTYGSSIRTPFTIGGSFGSGLNVLRLGIITPSIHMCTIFFSRWLLFLASSLLSLGRGLIMLFCSPCVMLRICLIPCSPIPPSSGGLR